ncbi:DUF6228 family protein [Pseudarthrobacter siccitolerans]
MATDKVEVGRPERLTFSEVQRGPDGVALSMVVTVDLHALTAQREVASHYRNGLEDLSSFFADLAEHWRGWSGTRAHSSLEGDLLLEAAHTGSHVELHFTLQDPSFHDSWSVRGKLTLDPGEELTAVSENLIDLLEPPQRSAL